MKRTSAALGTIKYVSTGLSGDFRRLDAGNIMYITVTSRLFVFWYWLSPHSHLQEWRIHLPVWRRQPAFLPPTVHFPGCPASVSAPQWVASWWSRVWDNCGYLCCTDLANMLRCLPLLLAFSFKGVSCCISSFRFDLRSLMWLTGGFHWFHRSFRKADSSDHLQELPLRLLTLRVTDPSAVLTELLSFFPSGWEIPPSYPRVLPFFHPTIYIPFSSSEGNACHIFWGLVLTHFRQCWKQTARYPSACYFCDAPGCFLHTRSYRWSNGAQQPLLNRR